MLIKQRKQSPHYIQYTFIWLATDEHCRSRNFESKLTRARLVICHFKFVRLNIVTIKWMTKQVPSLHNTMNEWNTIQYKQYNIILHFHLIRIWWTLSITKLRIKINKNRAVICICQIKFMRLYFVTMKWMLFALILR